MFAERAGLGPQYKMVSPDRLALWELSVLWRKEKHIHTHIKGTPCVSLSVEWSGNAAKQAVSSCVRRRVRDLRSRTAPAVFFSPAAKDPHPTFQDAELS